MKLRKSKNLTAKELGELIGITSTGIINYENDNAYPSRAVLLKLTDILGKNVLCDDYSKFIVTDYGSIIKQCRKDNNFSCSEAAFYIGISAKMLYILESMEYIITRKRFYKYHSKLKEPGEAMDYDKIGNLVALSKLGDAKAKESLAEEFTPLILNLAKKSFINSYESADIKRQS